MDGYQINNKGIELLTALENNPPKPRKSTHRKRTAKNTELVRKDGKEQFMVTVQGNDFNSDFVVYADSAKMMKALSAFHEELNK